MKLGTEEDYLVGAGETKIKIQTVLAWLNRQFIEVLKNKWKEKDKVM